MDEGLKEKLRKREILTYSRRKKVSIQTLPVIKVVHPPPPPPFHDLIPQPSPTYEDILLNIHVSSMIGKRNMVVGRDVKKSFCKERIYEYFKITR
jgi:hypothetical protein